MLVLPTKQEVKATLNAAVERVSVKITPTVKVKLGLGFSPFCAEVQLRWGEFLCWATKIGLLPYLCFRLSYFGPTFLSF